MKATLQIQTPDGYASKVHKYISWIILPKFHQLKNHELNKENNKVTYNIETDIKGLLELQKNVIRYQQLTTGVLNNKLFLKAIKNKATPQQIDALKEMLNTQTKIELIKEK